MSDIAQRPLLPGIGYTSAPSLAPSPASRAPEPGPQPADEQVRERAVERAVERPAEREPRRGTGAIPDYRQPSSAERAFTLRAAFERSGGDENQRLLLRELMDHYRDWCVRNGLGDPFREFVR